MSRFRYTQYIPNPLDEIDLDELMDQLKDHFLESGFASRFYGTPSDESLGLEGLLRALAGILSEHEALPEQWRRELTDYVSSDGQRRLSPEVRDLLEQLIERLMEAGYLRETEGDWQPEEAEGSVGEVAGGARFELTRKGVDFLGFKTLQTLLGSLGKSSFGSHATAALSTGVEADAHSRRYEFGDTLNLDVPATLLSAVRRRGLEFPLQLEPEDLRVHQAEYQSSCATVIMLDCSHSMILYGEDRFTPAKKVALALAHLIRTRFPGDSFELVLFHDSAEQIPLARLASVKVGPFHTNTCQGLRLSRRLLMSQKKDMRQIIMITDGKPSAMTLPDGRIYKNPFGLDPMILQETYREVAECRKSGILINTFMLARDYSLVAFVEEVARMCRGKAYFTSPVNLARHILLDFMNRKTTTVH